MKARVKATGDIIEISEDCSYLYAEHYDKSYNLNELEFLDVKEAPDYWTRLEHQYAGMAMQAMISNSHNTDYHKDWSGGYGKWTKYDSKELAEMAVHYAHALVEKLKEKEK